MWNKECCEWEARIRNQTKPTWPDSRWWSHCSVRAWNFSRLSTAHHHHHHHHSSITLPWWPGRTRTHAHTCMQQPEQTDSTSTFGSKCAKRIIFCFARRTNLLSTIIDLVNNNDGAWIRYGTRSCLFTIVFLFFSLPRLVIEPTEATGAPIDLCPWSCVSPGAY